MEVHCPAVFCAMAQQNSLATGQGSKSSSNGANNLLRNHSPATPLLGSKSSAFRSYGNSNPKRVLGVSSVVFIVYFNVCGGPWGSEEMMSDAGPLPGLIGIIVFAILWGLPLALVTSEMSSAYPDDGGYSLWVGEAFGGFWSFQESYYSWVSGVVDNAIYPGLVYSAIINVIAAIQVDQSGVDTITDYMKTHPLQKYLTKLTIATVFMLPNLMCIRGVGQSTMMLAGFVMLPFFVLVCLCIPHVDPERLFLPPWNSGSNDSGNVSALDFSSSPAHYSSPTLATPSSSSGGDGYFGYPTSWGTGWSDLMSVLYWNMSGYDCISTCAGEVKDVGRTIHRAMFIALAITVLSYVIPLSFATMALPPQDVANFGNDEGECSWACIARSIGGEWFMIWVFISSIAGNAGMYMAEMFEDSWQLLGMAEAGIMPKFLAKRHSLFGTPMNAVLVSYVSIVAMCYFDFMENLSINNFFSCGSCLLEIFAFIKLRWHSPDLPRPYRIPLDSWKIIAFLGMPIFLGFFVLFSCFNQGWGVTLLNVMALIFGFIFYYVMHRAGYRYAYNVNRQRLLSESSEETKAADVDDCIDF